MKSKSKPEASPAEVQRLRIAAGMTLKECAGLFGIGLRSWQKKEESGTVSSRGITSGEFDLLLLLAGEHPDYMLLPREAAARHAEIVRMLHIAGERLVMKGLSEDEGAPVSVALNWLIKKTE